MNRAQSAVVLAPAKVNLWLDVLGRRADGYHELDTCMLALELADRLTARATEGGEIELELSGPARSADIPSDARNLAFRAAERTRAALGARAGLALALEKRIPSQSGLGGASSDAAAAVIACEAALGAELGPAGRRALLAELGSDVSFFLDARGFARCRGRGEIVEPIDAPVPAWSVVLLTPDVHCPTPEVYAAWRANPKSAPPAPRAWPLGARAAEARALFTNALEPAALAVRPELGAWRAALTEAGAQHFLLSGSGASFFGLFDEQDEARASVARLRAVLIERRLAPRLLAATRALGSGAVGCSPRPPEGLP